MVSNTFCNYAGGSPCRFNCVSKYVRWLQIYTMYSTCFFMPISAWGMTGRQASGLDRWVWQAGRHVGGLDRWAGRVGRQTGGLDGWDGRRNWIIGGHRHGNVSRLTNRTVLLYVGVCEIVTVEMCMTLSLTFRNGQVLKVNIPIKSQYGTCNLMTIVTFPYLSQFTS